MNRDHARRPTTPRLATSFGPDVGGPPDLAAASDLQLLRGRPSDAGERGSSLVGIRALQGFAGNRAVAAALTPQPSLAPSIVQREGGTEHGDLSAPLQGRIAYYASLAYSNFTSAINQVRSEKLIEQIAEKDKKDPYTEIALAVAGLTLPMFAGAMLTPFAAETINELASKKLIPNEDVAWAHELVEKHLTEKAIAVGAWARTSFGTVTMAITGSVPLARLWSYLNEVQSKTAPIYVSMFDQAGALDAPSLAALAANMKMLASDPKIYYNWIRGRADHFMDTMAQTSSLPLSRMVVGDQMALINAYGKDRWAVVYVTPVGAWAFKRWLSPDMEEIAQASYAGKEPPRLTPQMLSATDHLPAPTREAEEGAIERRVVKMDAWGRFRYAWVHLPPGSVSSERYFFERWVPRGDEQGIQVYDQMQTGGIPVVSADVVYGKQTPTD